ncbi:hypothetical protein NOF04DRAFT_1348596 [Fusarium oxysporum II5]|nr:hypothetical protein NOF04DRAFT_1348596 [Fusarium oxysporum II5]
MEDGPEDGHPVTDHPDPEALVEALRKESTKRNGTTEMPSFSVTQIPDLYEPCVIPEEDLEPMPISDMRLKTHHRGKKVLLRVKTAPARVTTVVTIVEDEEGTAVLLALYQQLQEDLLTVRHPAQDSVAILKDPFFEQTAEGTYSLQVDHPSDIIWLEDHDERIPEKWRVHRKIKKSPDEKQQALFGRSDIYLKLDRPRQALLDAIEGDGLATSTEKPWLLQARAIYRLGKFEDVPAWSLQLHIGKSLKEQNDGAYAFGNMLIDAQETPPLINCATFSSLVETRVAPGRVMGLFLTEDLSAGDLILCGKAFSYYFMDDEKSHETYPILLNMSSKELTSGGSVHLWPQVTQKLNCRRSFIGDMQIIRATQDMSAGTKLLLSYRTPCAFESYAQVQKHLSTWGFKCACDLCKSRSKEDKAALEKRRKICHEASDLLKTEVLQFNCAKARTVLKQLEKTYNGKSADKVGLELSELCFGMNDRYTDSGMHADFVRMIVKSLESLGFVIVAISAALHACFQLRQALARQYIRVGKPEEQTTIASKRERRIWERELM